MGLDKNTKEDHTNNNVLENPTTPYENYSLPMRTIPPNHSQPVVNMISRHCSASECNAAETAEHPLQTCTGCKRVAYCNRKCQKLHWKPHKPVCLAAVAQYQKPEEPEHEREGEDISDRTDLRDENGNRVLVA